MVLLQTKHHGIVLTEKIRGRSAAYDKMNHVVAEAVRDGYVLVGSAPGMTMFICPEHTGSRLPADADFCYIVAIDVST